MPGESGQREFGPAAQARFASLAAQPLRTVAAGGGFITGATTSLSDLWHHRHLWWLLTRRELKARYKDSVLGYVWTLVRPLVNLLIYYLAIGKVLGAERSIPDFAIYIFAGLTSWTLFSQTVATATSSVVGNAGIVKKVYLPRELFPLASAGSSFVDSLSQLVILIIGAILIRGISGQHALLYVPISILVVLVWAIGFGLLLAAANVYLRDVQYLVEVGLMIGFWLTPSVYSFDMIASRAPSIVTSLYLLNPTALAAMGFQRGFWLSGESAVWPTHLLTRLGIALLVGVVFVFIAQRAFDRMQRNFAQEL